MMTSNLLRDRSAIFVCVVAIVIGLVIGALTLLLQELLPNDLIQFANSAAMWSILAFIIGRLVRTRRIAMLAGVLGLFGEVAGYFTLAYFSDLMDISTGTLAIVGYWLLTALVAGPIFGWAGFATIHDEGRSRIIGQASLGAIFMAEGLFYLSMHPEPYTGLLWLGIALALTVFWMTKNIQRWQVVFFTLGIGLIFFLGFNSLALLDALRAAVFQM